MTRILRILYDEILWQVEGGRSYNDIARGAGVAQSQISYFMSGARSSMDAETVDKLLEHLGFSISPPKHPPGRRAAPEPLSGRKPTFKRVR